MLELRNIVWSLPDGETIINGITMHSTDHKKQNRKQAYRSSLRMERESK